VLILEGLNALELGVCDFGLYIEAELEDIRRWYIARYVGLRPDDPGARAFAEQRWQEVHERNLRENVLPARARADAILRKRSDHSLSLLRARRASES
jgi:type I pantothenate kinase